MEKSNNVYPNMPNDVHGHPTAPPSYNATAVPIVGQAQYVIQQPINGPFGPHAQIAQCPNCGERAVTRIEYENGNKTHILALIMCMLGLWCCCCIPYCVDSMKNANHYCSKCSNFLGVYAK